jgi:hypothetical protein
MSLRVTANTLALVIACSFAASAFAQTSPQINDEESALEGSFSCNGGVETSVQVDEASTSNSVNNDVQASNQKTQDCGDPLISIGSVNDDASIKQGTNESTDAGAGNESNVIVLGGVLSYDTKSENDTCDLNEATNNISCNGSATFTNGSFAGQSIPHGTYTQPTQLNAVDFSVSLSGVCTLALFTGTLTIAPQPVASTTSTGTTVTMGPYELKGTLVCILGSTLLSSETVDLKDQWGGGWSTHDSGFEGKYGAVW